MTSHNYDLTFLQRELISSVYSLERFLKRPLVVDIDDAIFLHRKGSFARRLAHNAGMIICGNDYLADNFSRWNKNVVVIPTAVDTLRFVPAYQRNSSVAIIGWIGTSSNLKYVYGIEKALARVFNQHPDAYLRIISDSEPKFRLIKEKNMEFIPWSTEIEVPGIQGMTVGIMPLADLPWERGKCSYKMLLYMSCGIPVVVSPVGMNSQILSMGKSGLAAVKEEEWTEALLELLSDVRKRERMAWAGRKIIEENFSISRIVPILAACLHNLVK